MDACDFLIFIYKDRPELREERLLSSAALYSGMDADSFKKEVSETGKPYFRALPEVQFSITHSGGYWACAFGNAPVGLDMEMHRKCRIGDISKRFFHPSEHKYLELRGNGIKEFFDLWCAKESYVKFTGEGLSGLSDFSVTDGTIKADLRHIKFLNDFSMCLCSEKIGNIEIKQLY